MNATQFAAAIRISTEAALKSGKVSLPEIIGTLQIASINAERLAYQHAMARIAGDTQETTNLILPPNGIQLPRQ